MGKFSGSGEDVVFHSLFPNTQDFSFELVKIILNFSSFPSISSDHQIQITEMLQSDFKFSSMFTAQSENLKIP